MYAFTSSVYYGCQNHSFITHFPPCFLFLLMAISEIALQDAIVQAKTKHGQNASYRPLTLGSILTFFISMKTLVMSSNIPLTSFSSFAPCLSSLSPKYLIRGRIRVFEVESSGLEYGLPVLLKARSRQKRRTIDGFECLTIWPLLLHPLWTLLPELSDSFSTILNLHFEFL